MTADYDIRPILEAMEDELIASYRRNLARHTAEEVKEGFEWTMWQLRKMKDLRSFDRKAAEIVRKYGGKANREAQKAVEEEFRGGALHADELLREFGIDVGSIDDGSFFKANQYQVAALEQAIHDDLNNAGMLSCGCRMTFTGRRYLRRRCFTRPGFHHSGRPSIWRIRAFSTGDISVSGTRTGTASTLRPMRKCACARQRKKQTWWAKGAVPPSTA